MKKVNENADLHVYWHKVHEDAIIPTKRDEDAGYDLYTIEPQVVLWAGQKHLFDTGLQVAFDNGYWLSFWDRGSTGSRGIHIHCGVVDSGFRGNLFVCLSNDNPYPVVFTNKVTEPRLFENTCVKSSKASDPDYIGKALYYPISKGIAQAIFLKSPVISSSEVNDAEWEKTFAHNSQRGTGELGSSGK